MQLYLDSYGAYLSVRGGMFCVRTRTGGERTFAVRQVDALLLTKGTAMSTDAALLAVQNDLPVLLIDANTHYPLAQLMTAHPGGLATVRKNQAFFAQSSAGMAWTAAWIARKIGSQRALLRGLCERQEAAATFRQQVAEQDKILAVLQKGFERWQPPKTWDEAARSATAGQFRGHEGTASRVYFQLISSYLEGRVEFAGRAKRPAYDPLNALLNYIYGMLYTHAHLALMKSGLDPQLGILHADQYNRPTLVYDFIEAFRTWADEVALGLVDAGALAEADDFFEPADGDDPDAGLRLAQGGKGRVVDAMLAFLEARTAYEGKQVKRGVQADMEARRLSTRIREFQGGMGNEG